MEHYYQNIGEDWFGYNTLYSTMVKNYKNGGHFVEVGSWKGRSASFMGVEIYNNGKNIKFDCVDTWNSSEEHRDINSFAYEPLLETEDGLYNEFLKNINPLREIINPIRMCSLDAAELYEDESLDFVFIDAAHDYENVIADIKKWYPKIKKNGYLAGHDYYEDENNVWYGVKKAVHEFINDNNNNIKYFTPLLEQAVWVISK